MTGIGIKKVFNRHWPRKKEGGYQYYYRAGVFCLSVGVFIFFMYIITGALVSFFSSCRPLPNDPPMMMTTMLGPKSVVVLISATGKYLPLGLDLIDSGREFFCQAGCLNVTYLLFTDANHSEVKLIAQKDANRKQQVFVVRQSRLGWPDDSMKRFHVYLKQHATLKKFDFVLALDADLRFVSNVSLGEIYGSLVATQHPGYLSTLRWYLPFERSEPRSKAFVPRFANGACHYFTAAVWGGTSSSFIKALRTLVWQLDSDAAELGANFTAKWHDESHLNRYFLDNPPTRVLSPSFYFPEDLEYKSIKHYPKKIIALQKDHNEIRDIIVT